eukprot:COSAG05_NODE_510_length_9123_cov_3.605053_3_plen_283_part_00
MEFVFSDKTGTLTCNEMELMKGCVDSQVYGDGKPLGCGFTLTRDVPPSSAQGVGGGGGGGGGGGEGSGAAAGTAVDVIELNQDEEEEDDDEGQQQQEQGGREPTVRVLDAATGELISQSVPVSALRPAWAGDSGLPLSLSGGGGAAEEPGEELGGPIHSGRRADAPDVGLNGGHTAEVVRLAIENNHRSARDLELFWTSLAVCHQTEVWRHAPSLSVFSLCLLSLSLSLFSLLLSSLFTLLLSSLFSPFLAPLRRPLTLRCTSSCARSVPGPSLWIVESLSR